jgi:hypothetical protein
VSEAFACLLAPLYLQLSAPNAFFINLVQAEGAERENKLKKICSQILLACRFFLLFFLLDESEGNFADEDAQNEEM